MRDRVVLCRWAALTRFIQDGIEWLNRSRRRLATWGVGFLAMLMAYHVVFGDNGLLVYHQKRSESAHLQEQAEALKGQNEQILKRIRALKSDPRAIEREAREQLKYARPGEMVYTLPAKPEPASQPERK